MSAPPILKLKFVSRKDYKPIEDILDEILNESTVTYSSEPIYDELPTKLITADEFPMYTNLLCWNCDRGFSNRPFFIPTSIRRNDKDQVEIGCKGNFCSVNCAYSWICLHYAGEIKAQMVKRLQYVHKLFYGVEAVLILAHSKTIQKKYGGDLTEQQYNEKMQMLTQTILKPVVRDVNRVYIKGTSMWTLAE